MVFEAASALGLAVRGWTACGAPLLAATVGDRNLKEAVAKAIVQDRLSSRRQQGLQWPLAGGAAC
jgi:hypothetical protein